MLAHRTGMLLWRFAGDARGVFAVKFALLVPALLMTVGLAIDYTRFVRDKGILQAAADAAALAAAKELSLTDTKTESMSAVAQEVVRRHLEIRYDNAADRPAVTVTTGFSRDPVEVTVDVKSRFVPYFGRLFEARLPDAQARAKARIVGQPNICVLGLNPREGGTISLEQNARVTGRNCAVYSNSVHGNGLKSKNSAMLEASFICSRGGKDGGPGSFNPDPMVDCPQFDDPLADRPEPAVGACDSKAPTVITRDTTLSPGTYCGLEIRARARVTLLDGIFVIKDKPLVVTDGAALTGEAAGLYFTGASARLKFDRRSTISLKAPTTGPMAGLLIFGSRAPGPSLTHEILSDDARVLIGTIYVPKGELRIDAQSPIADQSAYTAIVADTMRLYGGPHLVLNTDYGATDIPVPEGIKGVGQPVRLAE